MYNRFTCGICGRSRSFECVARVYDTPERLGVITWPCWCWECMDVSLAEYVPEPSEILAEGRAWRRRDREARYRVTLGPMGWNDDEREAQALAYLDAVLAWRLRRRSTSRCLSCGSVMVSLSAKAEGGFEHPECGGIFRGTFSIFGGTVWEWDEHVYSTEGIKAFEHRVSGRPG